MIAFLDGIITNFQLYVDGFAAISFVYLLKRIIYPYKCTCERHFYTGHSIAKHLAMKHFYVDPTPKKK